MKVSLEICYKKALGNLACELCKKYLSFVEKFSIGKKVFQLLLLFFHEVACPIPLPFGMFASTFGLPSTLKKF